LDSSLLILYEGLHKDNLKTTDRLRHLSKRDSFGEDDLEDFEDLAQACHHQQQKQQQQEQDLVNKLLTSKKLNHFSYPKQNL
jgi:hypothetical protein